MKNKYSLLLVLGVLLFSCKEDAPENEIAVGQATVSGMFKVNKDITNDTNEFGNQKEQLELVAFPTNSKIQFFINGRDLQLDPVAGYTYQDVMIEAKVNQDGSYEVNLPVRKNQTSVRVSFPEIEDTYTYREYDPKLQKFVNKSETAVFGISDKQFTIAPNAILFLDYKYVKK